MSDLSGRIRPDERAVVVGSGIAGLTAAFRLKQAGLDVTVLERADRVGGRMLTVEREGYVIDAAASVLPTTYSRTMRLIADAGLGDAVGRTCDVLGIARPDGVHRIRGHRRTDLLTTSLLGVRSKLALTKPLLDMYRHRRELAGPDAGSAAGLDVETIQEYAERTLTREALDYFVQPLTSDFYLTPPHELSVVNLLYLLKTMLGAGFVNSPRGIRFLPESLARDLHVELSATVTSVEEDGDGVSVTWERPGEGEHIERASAAVVAVPAVHAPSLLPQLRDEQRDYLRGLTYARSMVVTLLLARAPAERSMWLTVPDRTHPDVNVMILDHNKAPGRVPAGGGLITIYWHRDWARARWDMHDDEIIPSAIAAAEQVLPDIEGHVKAGYVWRWDPCTVARPAGGFRDLAAFSDTLDPAARIQLAGDYFTITTVDSSVTSGERVAARILGALGIERN